MILKKSLRFNDELQRIIFFIALDNPDNALKFFDDLISIINDIPLNPFSHRRRESSNDRCTRDLIFKGYTIPYYIDTEKSKIIILGIYNQNKWEK